MELEAVSQGRDHVAVDIAPHSDLHYRTSFIGHDGQILEVVDRPEPRYRVHGIEGYARARVDDSDGRSAWLQAHLLDGRCHRPPPAGRPGLRASAARAQAAGMARMDASSGTLAGGLPFDRIGSGPVVVALQGLTFENRALSGMDSRFMLASYRRLAEHRSVHVVNRRPGLPQGCTLGDMAAHCAAMIRAEFSGPVDIIGISSGGSLALHLAAEHPDLVRRLVIQDCGCRQSESGRAWHRRAGQLARPGAGATGRWRDLSRLMMLTVQPDDVLGRGMAWLFSPLMARSAPDDPSGMIVLVEAEDDFDLRDRLGEISAPALIACGELDAFCSPGIARETADAIPDARLIVYSGRRHGVRGKQWQQDLVDFLLDDGEGSSRSRP